MTRFGESESHCDFHRGREFIPPSSCASEADRVSLACTDSITSHEQDFIAHCVHQSPTPPLAYVIFNLFGPLPSFSSSSFPPFFFLLLFCAPLFVAFVGVGWLLSLADNGGFPEVGVGACEGVVWAEEDGDSSCALKRKRLEFPHSNL